MNFLVILYKENFSVCFYYSRFFSKLNYIYIFKEEFYFRVRREIIIFIRLIIVI